MKSGVIFAVVTVCVMLLAGFIASKFMAVAPPAPIAAVPAAAPAPNALPASSLVTETKKSAVPEAAKLASLPTVADAAKPGDFRSQANAVLRKIQNKINDGPVKEADLAPELKELDALLAANKDNKSSEVAQVALMRAMIPAEFCDDPANSAELLKRVAADFPGTETAKFAAESLPEVQDDIATAAVRRSLVVGAAFPDFAVQDLDGHALSPANYKGKVVLVDFWATWCGPCVGEMPNVQAAYAKYHDQGFEIIGVSLDEERAKLTSFLKDQKIPWPQFFDGKGWQNALAVEYGVHSIPASFLIGRDGKITAVDARGPELGAAVAKALAQK